MAASRSFYVVAREPGAEHPALPTWASRDDNPAQLLQDYPRERISRHEVDGVPGAYQLHNVLALDECRRLINLSEELGYLEDAAVSLPRRIRHNHNMVWVTDSETDALIWQRVAHLTDRDPELYDHKPAVGLNARFRFYRYSENDYFRPHTDGSWPGSRVVGGELVANAYPDRYSLMTFLIFLNDDFAGGATRFLVPLDRELGRAGPCGEVDVRTPAGGVLCFPHGLHPLHCVHSSEPVTDGIKYVIRTDMLFLL